MQRNTKVCSSAWDLPGLERVAAGSEVPAALLFAFDGLEQRLEVALPKAFGTFALDDLEEHRRPVGQRLCEDLQQETVLVPINEDSEFGQALPRQLRAHVTHALTGLVV